MRALSTAAIIAVGSELLTPSRIDTNSLFITEQLNLLGIEIESKTIVGDDRAALVHAVQSVLERIDLLVCSGGLGPTDDDVTREVVAQVLNLPLSEDAAIASRIRTRFESRGMRMPEINLRQAMVPPGARVLDNTSGTAPGLWIEAGDRVVVLLPGPPRELEPMLTALADGVLKARAPGMCLVRRVVRLTGRTESHTEEAVRPLYTEWAGRPVPVSATILASLGQIELHLSARAASRAQADAAVEMAAGEVGNIIGIDVYSRDGRALEEVLGDLLAERGLHIAAAESCTGGLLTSRLTDVPGSSRYVERSVVAYSNQAKVDLLGVPTALIEQHGAVSEPVAVAMAEGIKSRTGVEVAIGVTGIAGPAGGTLEKPVGMVAIAAIVGETLRLRTFRFIGGREQVKFQASQAALDMVRRILVA